jgi:CRISPR/Cas system CSM-associated protein Csm5 (group 7 of RAMP superfamily)
MGKRAVPIKYLNDEGRDKSHDMENLYYLVLNSPKRPEEEKEDPKKMDQNHTICKNLVNHVSLRLSPHPIPLPTGRGIG